MDHSVEGCLFCDISRANRYVLFEDSICFVIRDQFPVSKGHLLIIPKKHYTQWFETPEAIQTHLMRVLNQQKLNSDQKFSPDGYNVGINCGKAAGQTIMHLHVHLIPRYSGDMPDPKGGVRGVIPGKQKY